MGPHSNLTGWLCQTRKYPRPPSYRPAASIIPPKNYHGSKQGSMKAPSLKMERNFIPSKIPDSYLYDKRHTLINCAPDYQLPYVAQYVRGMQSSRISSTLILGASANINLTLRTTWGKFNIVFHFTRECNIMDLVDCQSFLLLKKKITETELVFRNYAFDCGIIFNL